MEGRRGKKRKKGREGELSWVSSRSNMFCILGMFSFNSPFQIPITYKKIPVFGYKDMNALVRKLFLLGFPCL